MKKYEQLKKVLQKYNIEKPMPENIKKQMRKAKKAVLIQILKENKQYSLFIFLVLTVFLWFRLFGIGISVFKSALVVIVSSVVITAVVSTGSYYGIKYINQRFDAKDTRKYIEQSTKDIPIKDETMQGGPQDKPKTKQTKIAIQYRINVLRFTGGPETRTIAMQLSKKIVDKLVLSKGTNAANLIISSDKVTSGKVLTGSVSKLDEKYIVNVKVINSKTSEVILFITEEFEDIKNIDKLSTKIAAKVMSQL